MDVGISVEGAIELVQGYENELDWFVPEAIASIEKSKILKKLDLANTLASVQGITQGKKGVVQFRKWRRKEVQRIESIEDNLKVKKLSVFDRLILNKKKLHTVFDTLIRRARK